MGYKATDKCIANARQDERLFVLMARDITAPSVVVEWIKQNLGVQPPEKLHEALDVAMEMQRTRRIIADQNFKDKYFNGPNPATKEGGAVL